MPSEQSRWVRGVGVEQMDLQYDIGRGEERRAGQYL